MKRVRFLILALTVSACFSACTITNPELADYSTGGGIAGGAIGAGTGALIGDAVSSISVGEGTAIGAGIGIPVGAALGASYYMAQQDILHARYDRQIEANDRFLRTTTSEMEQIRNRQREESMRYEIDPSKTAYIYLGPTLGNPYR